VDSRHYYVASRRAAFTLVELLVVIAIIAILIALLVPAVQAVRETARRVHCANNVRQFTVAMHLYENANQRFPPGSGIANSDSNGSMWSAYVLPYIEQRPLYDTLNIDGPWNDPATTNGQALSVKLAIFQCPSSGVDDGQWDYTSLIDRVPSCYLAVSSGLNNRESGDWPWVGMPVYDGHRASDGIFYIGSRTKTTEIGDGLSNTLLIGESIPDQYQIDIDYSGNPQKVDHWYIGSREIHVYDFNGHNSAEISECMGSTACPINSLDRPDTTINDKELCFGSKHRVGVNMSFADGHVEYIIESIDAGIWSAMGSRNNGEIVSQEY
jgi:prepilin-type N-terminal cleavage/methylation domain-containing protein/prepilin-type processing-associated H-X9-DG protein